MPHSRKGAISGLQLGGILVAAFLLLLLVPGVRKVIFGESSGSENSSRYITEVAKAGPFRITVTEHGQLDSIRNVTLHNSVEGSTTIISIVPEGALVSAPVKSEVAGIVSLPKSESGSETQIVVTDESGTPHNYSVVMGTLTQILVRDGQQVKANDILGGDVVCELDSSALVDKERQQQIVVTQAEASLETAIKNLEIQLSTNDSLKEKAELAETLADLDLATYVDEGGSYEQERKGIDGQIKQIEEDLALAKEEYEYIRTQAKRGFKQQNELEAARIKVMKQEILLGVQQGSMKVLEEFTYKRTVAELKQMASDTKRETQRVELEGEAAIAQLKASLGAERLTLEVEKEKHERLLRQISNCKLVAPQAGEVVYANQNSRRSEPVVIEEGVTVRERQAIIKLPDLTQMKVDARIHESKISRVREGLQVEIKIDALPGDPFHGVLDMVSSVPVPGSWPNTDLKEYEASIRITDSEERVRKLKPGMTAEITIVVLQRNEDVLQVPVQGVRQVGPNYFAYVLKDDVPVQREVKIGDTNDAMVEVLSGINENEEVILNVSRYFGDELNELEQKYSAEAEAAAGRDAKNAPPVQGGSGPMAKGRPRGKGPGAGGQRGGKGRPGAGGGASGGGAPGGGVEAWFAKADKDGNGVLEGAEVGERTKMADGDGDGKVTKEEFSEAMKKFMQSRGGQ